MSDQEVQTGEVDEGGWATLIHAGLSPNMERNNWGCATSRAFREVASRTADTIPPTLLALRTPNSECRLSAQSALDNLQRDKFVLAIFEPRLSGVLGLHVGKHFRIVHNLSSVT